MSEAETAVSERNRFRETLDHGDFLVLGEVHSPNREMDPDVAGERIAAFERAALAADGIATALAVLDGGESPDFFRAAEFAKVLSPENLDRHLFYLSGRNTAEAELDAMMTMARSAGVLNFAAVSGGAVPGETGRELSRRRFMESTEILHHLQDWPDRDLICCGAAANPFQYRADALFAQYVKVIRKLRSGARFLVTQGNWDMLKLQSLRWYLNRRGLFVPTIARLMFLTPERVERILDGGMPGIVITEGFRKMLNQELRFSRTQFESAQWRRIELQSAGCRLLGFSGVQIAGLDKPELLTIAAERIAGGMREFASFEDWIEAYNSYQAPAEMMPVSNSFCLYDRSLHRVEPEAGEPFMHVPEPPHLTVGERFRHGAAQFLFPHADHQRADSRRLLKKLLAGCTGHCDKCTLEQSEYVCARRCPKRLNGICGEVAMDGTCAALGGKECIHCKIMRLARAEGRAGDLEDVRL